MTHLVKSVAVLFTAIAVSATAPAFAGPKSSLPYLSHLKVMSAPPSFKVHLTQAGMEEILKLQIENAGRKRLTVKLTDPDGNTQDVFNVSKDMYRTNKPYNFSSADEGIYTLEVTDGVEKVRKQIRLRRTTVLTVGNVTIE